jgi:branched-subunit amino acid ABC-type transport system permease component
VEPAGQPPLQAPVAEPGLLEQAGLLWAELRGLAHDQFELVALELRQACSRFALMVALALVAAALCATAWLGLAAAAVFWLIERGASPVDALLAAVGANLAVAALCVLLLRRESREMPFAATLRSFLSR